MNVAGALARSIRNDGTPDLELVTRLLVEAASTQPSLAIADESEGDGGETNFFTTSGISVEEVASRLIEPRFAELAQPVALADFIFSGSAGIPRLTKDEVDEFLADVTKRDPGFRRSWLELAPVDDSDSWVAYPQIALLSLDPGLDIMTETTHAPRVPPGTGCDPGATGFGATLSEVCLRAGCTGSCKETDWQVQRLGMRPTGCECRLGAS